MLLSVVRVPRELGPQLIEVRHGNTRARKEEKELKKE